MANVSQRISIETRGLNLIAPLLDKDLFEQAYRRTCNELAKQSRTAAKDSILTKYTPKSTELKKRMALKLATSKNGDIRITVTFGRMPLWAFQGTSSRKDGVGVQVKQGSGRKVLPWSFVTTVASAAQDAQGVSHKGVFFRMWRGNAGKYSVSTKRQNRNWLNMPGTFRTPIKEVFSIGPSSMFDQQPVYEAVQGLVNDKLFTIFARNYAYYADKKGMLTPLDLLW